MRHVLHTARSPRLLFAIAALALGCVGAALIAQYRFDIQPCAWCVLQRLIYLVIAVLALLGALVQGFPRRVALCLALVNGCCGIGAALWQHFYAANTPSCDLTLAEKIIHFSHLDRLVPDLFVAYASCSEAAVSLGGISFALWSCGAFALLTALILRALRAKVR